MHGVKHVTKEVLIMELREILRALLWIVAASSFGLSVLSFFSLFKMKSVPKKKRNLMEYQKPQQYISLGAGAMAIAVITALIALWI